MVKRDYIPYFPRDPSEAELFEKVFGEANTADVVKNLFECSRKQPIIDGKSGKKYTSSNFQDYLKDKYELDDSLASGIYTFLRLTIIEGKKPEYAVRKAIDKIIELQKGKITSAPITS